MRPRDPVPYVVVSTVPIRLKAPDAAHYHAVELDRAGVAGWVSEVPLPRREESRACARLGPGHLVGFGVGLEFEQRRQILGPRGAEMNGKLVGARVAAAHGSIVAGGVARA